MSGVRVRWRPDLRRWVEDAAGVDLETARRHGGGPMPLARAIEARLKAAVAAAKAKAELKAARAAAARERRLAYFRAYYVKTLKERRRLQRAAAIT